MPFIYNHSNIQVIDVKKNNHSTLIPVFLLLLLSMALLTHVNKVYAGEFTGYIGLEGRYFFDSPAHLEQEDGGFSISLLPEYRHKWNDGSGVFTFVPFLRKDFKDDDRTHADIRQLDLISSHGDWEFQAGISEVFWGVTEAVHLVNIINQTDNVENIDGEDKLGQPLLRASHFHRGGSFNLYVMPYFRERTFPGKEGRLRTFWEVDDDDIEYESGREQNHVDFALRFQHTIDEIDLALSYFDGTSREPDLIPDFNQQRLKQYYPQIQQTGLDLQYTGEEWLWKMEAIHRHSKNDDFVAIAGGFEYTEYRAWGTDLDVGLLAEYLFDSRDNDIAAVYQNDLFLGTRIVLNDLDSTEFLFSAIIDLDKHTTSYRLEGSTKLSEDLKLIFEMQIFSDIDKNDAFYDLRNDNYLQLEIQKFY